ncbi:MAG: N-succinylarginine dihydrolase [Phycisphaeraceae bacterium]|nr:N-succinylarginine dihydrolase [Phycisphaeraceae bacterium]
MPAREFNFDGLVGPTHNYAGLALGNLASQAHRHETSSPKAAALQGLAKMKHLRDLGVCQAVLPPQERPHLATLRRIGFTGTDAEVLSRAHREAPHLLAACASASCMWAANAATVSPSADTKDGRVHFTAANLVHHLHRSIEANDTARVLRRIFADPGRFAHHDPLPSTGQLADEGAANHLRLCATHGAPGIELFVHGAPSKVHRARQQRRASETVARLHGLDPQRTFFVEQAPEAIDAGAFHNDVVSVANQNVLFGHAAAFAEGWSHLRAILQPFNVDLQLIRIDPDRLSLEDAVATYLFNSQIVTIERGADAAMALVCPTECREHGAVRRVIDALTSGPSPIHEAHFVDTRQSMRNGGGPACLRLRVVLTDDELAATHAGVLLTDDLYGRLVAWVNRHYRDTLGPDDLADPRLLDESRAALDDLSRLLALEGIYAFQA